MGRPRLHRLIATCELVSALRTSLDPGQTMRNRVINGLIITQLKVEARVMFGAAPISAVKCFPPDKIECPGDRFSIANRKREHDIPFKLVRIDTRAVDAFRAVRVVTEALLKT